MDDATRRACVIDFEAAMKSGDAFAALAAAGACSRALREVLDELDATRRKLDETEACRHENWVKLGSEQIRRMEAETKVRMLEMERAEARANARANAVSKKDVKLAAVRYMRDILSAFSDVDKG